MARITQTLLVVGVLLVATTAIGASAFTSASIDRDADIDVVADEDGLLALIDGNSGNLVYQDAETDQLVIDFENGTALGANTDALFELGDPDDPGDRYAFQVKNNDDDSHWILAKYTPDTDDGNDDANIEFQIYDDEDAAVGTVTEEGDVAAMNADTAEAYNVVIVVDTGHGDAETLTSTDDLSGTLEFTVDPDETEDFEERELDGE